MHDVPFVVVGNGVVYVRTDEPLADDIQHSGEFLGEYAAAAVGDRGESAVKLLLVKALQAVFYVIVHEILAEAIGAALGTAVYHTEVKTDT